MKDFFKKYWTHILNLSFLIYMCVLFYFIFNNTDALIGNVRLLYSIELLFCFSIFGEMIFYMVHAAKHKEIKNHILCAVLIYLFNVFYVPCYCLKHVSKDENYKIKNAVYLVVSILLYIFMFIVVYKAAYDRIESSKVKTYVSSDNVINVSIPGNYYRVYDGKSDLSFSNNTSEVFVYLYDRDALTSEGGYILSSNNILSIFVEDLYDNYDDVKFIDEVEGSTVGKKINTKMYEGYDNGKRNVYIISTVFFTYKSNYLVCVVEVVPADDYNSNRDELCEIIKNIELR